MSPENGLETGLAVLKLLIGRGAPADAQTIAIKLELPQAATLTALDGLRGAGFVELSRRKYAIREAVLEEFVEASRRELRCHHRRGRCR